MELRDINTVSSMQKIYIPPIIVKQVLNMINNLDVYIQNQDIEQLNKNIQSHTEVEGNIHNVQLRDSDLHKLLIKLYLEWKQKYPTHDYNTFLKTLVDEYQYFLTLIPDTPTNDQKTQYLITVCSLIYYFNRIHGMLNTVHNGLFDEHITKIRNNITNNNNYIKNVYFYFNIFNTNTFMKNTDKDLNIVVDNYYNRKQEYQQQNTDYTNKYLLGIPSIYESLDYLIGQYQTLLDWQYNYQYRRTIGLFSTFTFENLLYYKPIYIGNKLTFNPNTELFLNFTYGQCNGITHLFTLRKDDGTLELSIYADSRDSKFYLAINEHDNSHLQIYPMIDDISMDSLVNYKIILRTDNFNKSLHCDIVTNNITSTLKSIVFDDLPTLPYFPEYVEIPFKFDMEDKIKYNSYHEILAYDRIKYPQLHNQLLGIH